MLSSNKPIWKSALLQHKVLERHQLEMSRPQVCRILRKEYRLGYKKVSPVPVQANSERCLVLRQQYALRVIDQLELGVRVINVDESWVNQTQYNRRSWKPSDGPTTVTLNKIKPRLSLIAALDTDGKVYFALLHANTDSDIMVLFLTHLFRQLDVEDPGWISRTLILLDGAKYHTSEQCTAYLRASGARVMYSGPYSFGKSLSGGALGADSLGCSHGCLFPS